MNTNAVGPAPSDPVPGAAPTEPHEAVGTPDLTATEDALGGNANLPNPEHDPSTDAPPNPPSCRG